ncbi:polysaccharide pyruvyl transferase family protein [Pedobacter boryungensis]|uniref:Polysaccharide pyruvyl transferase family protein n=1 Tax=Pedobacter boryungensis TaxID=869962 RepID=A0ABX2DI03_9SPHI|nr:polysaccharide pyruvyl transferase family protein [Pedobacter boryungensis]NQX32734.1 polysaccharide pyruvyl transferase family protein [Pedobacter boryungensis]
MSTDEFRKIVIFGSYNKQSVGDKAILISIIDLLFKNSIEKIYVEVICFDVEAIKEELKVFSWFASVNVVPFQEKSSSNSVRQSPSRGKSKWKKIIPLGILQTLNSLKFYFKYKPNFDTKADLLIIGGGNLLMDLFPSWLIMPFLITRKFKCPYVIAGVGAFPIKTNLGNFLIKQLLKKSSFNFVRDQNTYDLIKNKYKIDCHLHPDFAFSYPNNLKQTDEMVEDIVAVNVAPVFGEHWPYRNIVKYNNFINIISESLHAEILSKNATSKILFFDSNYPTDRLGAIDVINHLMAKGIDKSRLIYEDKLISSYGLIQMFLKVKYCIVTRLHAGILGLDANLPVLGIAYQPKVKDVFDLVGLGGNVIDIEDIDSLPNLLRDYSRNRDKYILNDEVKLNLERKNQEVIEKILKIIN